MVGGEIRPAKQGEEARASLAPLRHNCTDPAEDRREQIKERSPPQVGEPERAERLEYHTLSLSLFCIFILEREKGQNGELVVARG